MRIRDLGYSPGVKPTGPTNSILDIPGVGISQVTLPTTPDSEELGKKHGVSGPKKGVTILLPRPVDQAHIPCHAATHVFNGNGEMTGRAPIADWGFINMPIVLTNSCSLGVCFDAAMDFMIDLHTKRGADDRELARNYGTPVCAETADWWVNNNLKASKVRLEDVERGFANVKTLDQGGEVLEGSHGGGAGMTCHEYKGGTGTASRVVGGDFGGTEYLVGVLAQTNYGRQADLVIGGVPVGRILAREQADQEQHKKSDVAMGRTEAGSLVIVIFTNAPLLPHQLDRLARHATPGVAQVGSYGVGKTFSGDIFLAVSTAEHPKEQLTGPDAKIGKTAETYQIEALKNESIDCFFEAIAEAVEEAILNSLVGARDGMAGTDGSTVLQGLPVDRVKALLAQYKFPV